MTLPVVIYNLAMAAVDGAALGYLRRRRTASAWLVLCAAIGVAAVGAAGAFSALPKRESVLPAFAFFHLLAYGVFLHGPLVLAAAALVVWRSRRAVAIGSAALAAVLVAVAVDAFLVEPNWLEVSHVRLRSAKLSEPVRIVLVADLQTDTIGPYQRNALRRAVQAQPDLILFAGDYLQAEGPERLRLGAQLNELLEALPLSAPAGAFAVQGNIDPAGWEAIFAGLPVRRVDRTRSFELDGLRLTCLSQRDAFDPSLRIAAPDGRRFHVVLGHSPNFALGHVEADLLLAGHTHGGQVRLPLVGPVLTLSAVPRRWAAGLTQLPGGARLLVSRGIGMEGGGAPKLRFLCRPELVVIDLVPE